MNGETLKAILTVLLLPMALSAQTGNSSLARPIPRTEEEDARRRTPVVQAVDKAASAVINIYVQVGDVPRDIMPFAQRVDFMTEGAGSGVVIDTSGLAITNWHVVASATEKSGEQKADHRIEITLNDSTRFEATVLSIDPSNDLALLKIQLDGDQTLPAVELGDSETMLLGETVIAIGNPLGRASSVSVGILSAVDQEVQVRSHDGVVRRYKGLLQTDAPINPGNSGGALIDLNGKLIGINNAKSQLASGIGFAIPVSTVRAVFRDKLVSSEALRGVFVGMSVEDAGGAVTVTEIDPEGPAGRAGVRVGDHLIAADGMPVVTGIDWNKAVLGATTDRDLPLVVQRDGQQLEFAPRPLANSAYRVIRMTGIELEEVPIRDAREAITAASIELLRYSSGNPMAEPREYMASSLRVIHVRPESPGQKAGIRTGDLLLGVEITVKSAGFDEFQISSYQRLDEIHESFVELTKNGTATGKCLLLRDGRVIARQLEIQKIR